MEELAGLLSGSASLYGLQVPAPEPNDSSTVRVAVLPPRVAVTVNAALLQSCSAGAVTASVCVIVKIPSADNDNQDGLPAMVHTAPPVPGPVTVSAY